MINPDDLRELPAYDREWKRDVVDFYGGKREEVEVWDRLSVWRHWIDHWAERIEQHWDNAIVITGEVGSSKSTAALHIGLDLTQGRLSLQHDVIYNLLDLLDRLLSSKPGDVVVGDEAVLIAQARPGGTDEVFILERCLTLSRELGVTLILCIPDIHALAKGVRDRRVTYWLHVEERGYATVFELSKQLNFKMSVENVPFVKAREPFSHVEYEAFANDDPFWMEYSRLKHLRTLREIGRARDEVAANRAKAERAARRAAEQEPECSCREDHCVTADGADCRTCPACGPAKERLESHIREYAKARGVPRGSRRASTDGEPPEEQDEEEASVPR